jgi:NADP-dependent 3-hydroxy acid dehydrogenase YdfG
MSKIVLITGASAGFGKACAEKFAASGYNVILTGRRSHLLEEHKDLLESATGIKSFSLPFDVQNKEEVFAAVASLPDEWRDIDVLVNNAGLALGRDNFDEADLDDWETMINTNVKGLLYVTRAVLPAMIKRKKGHIINVGSIAGQQVYEKGNVYCASKAAVNALSRSMRIDLLQHRIKVTAIHPGAAETEFGITRFKGDEATARKVYEGYQPLSATDVADAILHCASLPEHVCINDLEITCLAQANAFYTYKS